MKIGCVYDGSIRDNGTGFLFRGAMAKEFHEQPEWFTEALPIKKGAGGCDFLIHVDDGRDDLSARSIPHPWGYWAIDTHLGYRPRLLKAREADIVWCAQLPAVERFRKDGVNAKWLPLACEPTLHPTASELGGTLAKRWDLAFVGYMQDPKQSTRVDFLDTLFRAFPNSWLAPGHFHHDMAKVYHRARIGVNHAIRDDLNMRFFELASVGVPQLCDSRMQGLEQLGFHPYVHYIPYSTTEEAVTAARVSIKNTNNLHLMAAAALDEVRTRHTYQHRLQSMVSDIKEHLSC